MFENIFSKAKIYVFKPDLSHQRYPQPDQSRLDPLSIQGSHSDSFRLKKIAPYQAAQEAETFDPWPIQKISKNWRFNV